MRSIYFETNYISAHNSLVALSKSKKVVSRTLITDFLKRKFCIITYDDGSKPYEKGRTKHVTKIGCFKMEINVKKALNSSKLMKNETIILK